MTDEERMTNAPRRPRSDRGEPRGPGSRKHCGICGAEGVDRRTCTGDAGSHAALDQGYKPTALPRVQGPSTATHATGTTSDRTPNEDLEGLSPDEAAEHLTNTGVLAADVEEEHMPEVEEVYEWPHAWRVRDQDALAAQDHIAHEVTVTVVTRYPTLVMGRLEHLIEENLEEALWVSTRSYGLSRTDA